MCLNDIQVAFDDHGRATVADGRPTPIESEKQPAFVKEHGLRRVDVFGLFIRIERATAKSRDSSAFIANRDHQAIAEAVVYSAVSLRTAKPTSTISSSR